MLIKLGKVISISGRRSINIFNLKYQQLQQLTKSSSNKSKSLSDKSGAHLILKMEREGCLKEFLSNGI